MLKHIAVGATLVALCPITSNAQDRVIVDERPAVVVPAPPPPPGVTVERRGPAMERREIETTGRGCDSKTVTRDTPAGSTSVTKERC
jgi:hypothetical protein